MPLKSRHWARLQALLGGIFLLTFLVCAVWARFTAPYRDDWDWLLFHVTGPGGLAGLLAPHNEHSIPLARLLAAWQYRLQGATGSLVQNAAVACHIISVAMFWMEIRREWPGRPALRAFAVGTMLVCLGSMYQLQSVVFGAAILFPLVQMWLVLALVAVLQATDAGTRQPRAWWVAAVAASFGAAASMTTGLVVPLIVAGVAWGRGAPRRAVLPFLALAVVGGVGYARFVGLGGSGNAVDVRALGAYVAAVFGAGATSLSVSLGTAAGAIVLLLMGAAVVTAARRVSAVTRLEWFAMGVMGFGVISAIAAAFGRAQFGVMQAGQSRYATFVMEGIAGLLLFAGGRLDRMGLSQQARSAVGALGVAACAALLVPHLYIGLLWKAKADNIAAAYLSVRSGAPDVQWLLALHPLPDVILEAIAQLEARGDRLTDPALFTVVDGVTALPACGGQWTLVRHGRARELRLAGQAPLPMADGVIVDRGDMAIGLSQRAPWVNTPEPSATAVDRAVRVAVRRRGVADSQWLGFAQHGAGPPYRWVGRNDRGRAACAQPLDVTPAIHGGLDTVRVEGAEWLAIGWAFACDSPVETWDLRVDGRSVPARVTAGLPRPDVADAFRSRCSPRTSPGVHLRFDSAALPAGAHTATLRVVAASGHDYTSAPLGFRR